MTKVDSSILKPTKYPLLLIFLKPQNPRISNKASRKRNLFVWLMTCELGSGCLWFSFVSLSRCAACFGFCKKSPAPEDDMKAAFNSYMLKNSRDVAMFHRKDTYGFCNIFHWPFHQKLVSKSHLTTLFCQSLHHLLTPNASSFFVKSSAVFIRENFLRFAGLQFEVGDDCMQVSPKVCDDCQGGLLWFTFQRANHNWSDRCNMIILQYRGKIPNFRFWGHVLTWEIWILFT